jgi:hypothetical protein
MHLRAHWYRAQCPVLFPHIILERVRGDIGSQWYTGTQEDFASRVIISSVPTSRYG